MRKFSKVLQTAAAVLAITSCALTANVCLAQQNPQPPKPDKSEKLPPALGRLLGDGNGTVAKKPAKRMTPLELVMKDGIPEHAEQRARLRDELYALLATSATAKESKKIARQIERIWRKSGSDTVSVLMGRSYRSLKAKDHKLALNLLDTIVELAPDNAEAWNRRAFVHYTTKNYGAAVGDLRRALALDANHYKALDGLASIFLQLGDDAKALAVYEKLRLVYPHWPGLDKAYENLKKKVKGRGI